jgi:hypothetical protein
VKPAVRTLVDPATVEVAQTEVTERSAGTTHRVVEQAVSRLLAPPRPYGGGRLQVFVVRQVNPPPHIHHQILMIGRPPGPAVERIGHVADHRHSPVFRGSEHIRTVVIVSLQNRVDAAGGLYGPDLAGLLVPQLHRLVGKLLALQEIVVAGNRMRLGSVEDHEVVSPVPFVSHAP